MRNGIDEIYISLMSHGVEGIGHVPYEQWNTVVNRASVRGRIVGNDPSVYPRDFASYILYHDSIATEIPGPRYPFPPPVGLPDLSRFLRSCGVEIG
ncbi:MAG: hypothetical protein GF401_16185 [Chitinivibrionales bacterium]|nr:hypothetical protein [Chitinivibrionales bacterium]